MFFSRNKSRYFRSTVLTENNLVNSQISQFRKQFSFSCDIFPEPDLRPRQTSKMELLRNS